MLTQHCKATILIKLYSYSTIFIKELINQKKNLQKCEKKEKVDSLKDKLPVVGAIHWT